MMRSKQIEFFSLKYYHKMERKCAISVAIVDCCFGTESEETSPRPTFDLNVFSIPDTFDSHSVTFDDLHGPPGYATRAGFLVRIVPHEEALRLAVEAAIIDCLAQPLFIWMRSNCQASRNAFIELSRAFPSICAAKKREICTIMRDRIPEVLMQMARTTTVEHGEDRDFFFALAVSQYESRWDVAKCENCKRTRNGTIRIAVLSPCRHVLCAESFCLFAPPKDEVNRAPKGSALVCEPSRRMRCPICATEDAVFDCIINSSIRAGADAKEDISLAEALRSVEHAAHVIIVDPTLHVPRSIVDRIMRAIVL